MNLASETTPPCLLFLSLPVVSPQAPPLHSPLTRWSTNGNRDQLSQRYIILAKTSLPDAVPSKLTLSGVVSRSSLHVDRTVLTWTQTQQRESQWQLEGLPEAANAIGDTRQNDRDGSTHTSANSLRVISSRRSIPGKIWMPTNQIKSTSACAHASRELRTRALQASRGTVYKESWVAYRAIQVRVS